jgi:hypothetical protein
MNRNVKRPLALTLLAVPLMFPAAMPKARESADPPTEMVRAVRRVRMAKIPRDQAETIQIYGPLRGVVNVQGRLIRPYDGNSIWQLTNGGYAIFGFEPTAQAMQTWTKDLGEGWIFFMVCYCPEHDPNTDDGCKFDDVNNPTNPGLCRGPTTCCKTVQGYIDDVGNGVIF